MDPLQFAYWLQGFAELNNGVPPNDAQWKSIRDHLNLVFKKATPTYDKPVYRDLSVTSVGSGIGMSSNNKYTVIC